MPNMIGCTMSGLWNMRLSGSSAGSIEKSIQALQRRSADSRLVPNPEQNPGFVRLYPGYDWLVPAEQLGARTFGSKGRCTSELARLDGNKLSTANCEIIIDDSSIAKAVKSLLDGQVIWAFEAKAEASLCAQMTSLRGSLHRLAEETGTPLAQAFGKQSIIIFAEREVLRRASNLLMCPSNNYYGFLPNNVLLREIPTHEGFCLRRGGAWDSNPFFSPVMPQGVTACFQQIWEGRDSQALQMMNDHPALYFQTAFDSSPLENLRWMYSAMRLEVHEQYPLAIKVKEASWDQKDSRVVFKNGKESPEKAALLFEDQNFYPGHHGRLVLIEEDELLHPDPKVKGMICRDIRYAYSSGDSVFIHKPGETILNTGKRGVPMVVGSVTHEGQSFVLPRVELIHLGRFMPALYIGEV